MLMRLEEYNSLKSKIAEMGYGHEIEWASKLKPCEGAQEFFWEYLWVICNSGVKNQVARTIFRRVVDALISGEPVSEHFGHPGKSQAIETVRKEYRELFEVYRKCPGDASRLDFLAGLPWIGEITKFHLAKNLGITSICKPDRHLVRIADSFGMNPQDLCEKLSSQSGDSVAVVDSVIWRAANLGLV